MSMDKSRGGGARMWGPSSYEHSGRGREGIYADVLASSSAHGFLRLRWTGCASGTCASVMRPALRVPSRRHPPLGKYVCLSSIDPRPSLDRAACFSRQRTRHLDSACTCPPLRAARPRALHPLPCVQ